MRRFLRIGVRAGSASMLVAAVLFAFPAIASAKNSFGPKVDDSLASLAESAPPSAPLRVIVFGGSHGLANAAAKGHLKIKQRLDLIGADSATVRADELADLAADEGVRYVAPDLPVAPTAAGLPLSFPALATLFPQIDGAPTAWSQGYSGAGIGVAVIDSGVVPSADFGTRLTQVQLGGQTTVTDTYGHGTFVAGIVGGASSDGKYVGVAPSSSIYAIDVNDPTGVYTSNIINGLSWVDANRLADNIRVVNISLAETVASSYLTSPLDSAVEQLWRDGIVVVVSAGNLGPGTMQYAPANDPFAIAVGAIDAADTLSTLDDSVASWSSSGITSDGFSKPDLFAPGRHIPSILPPATQLGQQAPLANILAPGYATMSGTSFAAPQVAGAAALLLQEHPDWTPDQVKWVLSQTGGAVVGMTGRSLSIPAALAFIGAPGAANQGVAPAPPPGGTTSTTSTSNTNSWNTNSWNTNSWNTNSWNTNSWNYSSWD